MQAAGLHQAAAQVAGRDSDSDEASDDEASAEAGDWEEHEEVSPEDERAMAAFMVCASPLSSSPGFRGKG